MNTQTKEMIKEIKKILSSEKEHILSQELKGENHITNLVLCLENAIEEKNIERIWQECLNLSEFSKINLADVYTAEMAV
jgi:hypothetical protein